MITTKQLQLPAARARLAPRGKPYFVATGTPGLRLGYRRLTDAPGTWTLAKANGTGGTLTELVGTADDREAANGHDILTFAQAVEAARRKTRGGNGSMITVRDALDAYEADLDRRGRNPYNAIHLETLLPDWLLQKPVAELRTQELASFRDSLDLTPVTLARTLKPLRAALNLAAKMGDGQILNTMAWKHGLATVNADRARDIHPLTTEQVNAIIDAAYRHDDAFGLFVEVAAETGVRAGQLERIMTCDLEADRLLVPPSRKGSAAKDGTRTAVPITTALAARLRAINTDPLVKRSKKKFEALFRAVVTELDLSSKVTLTALRSAAICRQILAGVPIALIARRLDTSTDMIEKHYAAQIDKLNDAMARKGLLERSINVIPMLLRAG